MNRKRLKWLFNINLLYANSALTTKYRNKYVKNGTWDIQPTNKIYKDLLRTNIISAVSMFFLYAVIVLPVDFRMFPNVLDASILAIFMFSSLQGFTYFYNIFYESKDVESLMTLPISSKEIFLSKISVASLSVLQMLSPILVIFLLFFLKNGMGVTGVIYSIVLFVVFFVDVILFNVFFMEFLSKFSFLSKFKTTFITLISTLTQFAMIGFIIYLNSKISKMTEISSDGRKIVQKPGPISGIFLNGRPIIFVVGIVIVTAVLCYLVYRKISGNFIGELIKLQSDGSAGKSASSGKSSRRNSMKRSSSEKSGMKTFEKDAACQPESMKDNNFEKSHKKPIPEDYRNKKGIIDFGDIIAVPVSIEDLMRNYKRGFSDDENNECVMEQNGSHIDDIYDSVFENDSNRTAKVDKKKLFTRFFKYNLSLINDSTLITSAIITPGILPIILIAPNFFNFKEQIMKQSVFTANAGYAFTLAILFALVMAIFSGVSGNSLSSVMFSLERDNYEYMKSMPIGRKFLVKSKLAFSIIITGIVPLISVIGVVAFLRMNILVLIMFIPLYILLAIPVNLKGLLFDLKYINVDWQNVTELFYRTSRAKAVFMLMMTVFFTIIMTVATVMISFYVSYASGLMFSLLFYMIIFTVMTVQSYFELKNIIK